MNVAEARALLTEFHEARKKNDPDTLRPFFAEGATFSVAGQLRENSIAMEVIDKAGFEHALHEILRDWRWIDVDFKTVMADGDLVVVRYLLTVEHVPSQQSFTTDIVDFVTVRDGKITDMRQFVDTAHLGAVAGWNR
ncbi:MAG: nuclear transport factor 2 family protein [Pseudomonadota bacterium]